MWIMQLSIVADRSLVKGEFETESVVGGDLGFWTVFMVENG